MLTQILDTYTPESELPKEFPAELRHPLGQALKEDWRIFPEILSTEQILNIVRAVCGQYADSRIFHEMVGILDMVDVEFTRNRCIMTGHTWEEFCKIIKEENRFHPGCINLKTLEELFLSPILQMKIKAGEGEYFRGRIQQDSREPYLPEKMGPPPSDKATAGRANSKGIPCLYLAGNVQTTFHEIRARDLDDVSVGTFVPTEDCTLIDLTKISQISPFAATDFSMSWFATNMKVLEQISADIARPLRRWEDEREYLSTQYIADFIKSLGYDGICYQNTLIQGGIDFAIFSIKKFLCKEVRTYHIEKVNYDTK